MLKYQITNCAGEMQAPYLFDRLIGADDFLRNAGYKIYKQSDNRDPLDGNDPSSTFFADGADFMLPYYHREKNMLWIEFASSEEDEF